MKRERFQIEPATHTLDLRAEFKQFFHSWFVVARARSSNLTQRPFIVGE
jgi:hypothetical protein